MGKVTQTEGEGDGIHALVGKGKLEGIAEMGLSHPSLLGAEEKGRTEIKTDSLRLGKCLLEKKGDIARAAGQIEDFFRVGRKEGRDKLLAPAAVETKAEETVEEIVGGGELAKESLYSRGVIG